MDNEKPGKPKKAPAKARTDYAWVGLIFGMTMCISALFSWVADELLAQSLLPISFVVLFAIVGIGIVFDMIGVAFTAAPEQPFHSMAARKLPEAQQALTMLRHADRVSSICNDVVGDICGIVSGGAATAIAANAIFNTTQQEGILAQLLLSAAVAGITVGGKAFGKAFAINNAVQIVHSTAKTVSFFQRVFQRKIRR